MRVPFTSNPKLPSVDRSQRIIRASTSLKANSASAARTWKRRLNSSDSNSRSRKESASARRVIKLSFSMQTWGTKAGRSVTAIEKWRYDRDVCPLESVDSV
jgi:hypothetical protein